MIRELVGKTLYGHLDLHKGNMEDNLEVPPIWGTPIPELISTP